MAGEVRRRPSRELITTDVIPNRREAAVRNLLFPLPQTCHPEEGVLCPTKDPCNFWRLHRSFVSLRMTTELDYAERVVTRHDYTCCRCVSLNRVGYFSPNPSSRSIPICAIQISA